MSAPVTLTDMFHATPDAVMRQGKALFAPMPLYRSKQKHTAVYINQQLYMNLFNVQNAPSFEEMAAALELLFSSTIEPEKGTGDVIGTAYADRQADPLNLSLAGNQGSGRAYYVGRCFNIKGERTVLATSDRKRFSDGYLEMERCIWEAVVGNALQGAITTGLNGVLAIFDMNERCDVVWRDKPVKRGKIIRIDEGAALDRITHLFYRQQPVLPTQWEQTATAFGRLEGDKFIERIIHGTWSPGNISPNGHLIDFDTVGAVKGRSPQFSSTRWHHENYFGFEYHGQLNVIEAMTKDSALNPDCLPFAPLRETLLFAMQRQIAMRFVSLMGFADAASVYARHETDIDALCVLWVELARKGFRKHDEMSTKTAEAAALHLFDFSHFFRIYPLLKRAGSFDARRAVAMMMENDAWDNPYSITDDSRRPSIEQDHLSAVYQVIGDSFVGDEAEAQLLQIACLHFVRQYDALHERIAQATAVNMFDVERQAYIINEDRFYLFPAYTATFQMAKNDDIIPPHLQNKMIETLVLANSRSGDIADVKIYQEGYLYRQFDDTGRHNVCFRFYDEKDASAVTAVKIGPYKLEKDINIIGLYVCTRPLDNLVLLKYSARESSLHIDEILLLNS